MKTIYLKMYTTLWTYDRGVGFNLGVYSKYQFQNKKQQPKTIVSKLLTATKNKLIKR